MVTETVDIRPKICSPLFILVILLHSLGLF